MWGAAEILEFGQVGGDSEEMMKTRGWRIVTLVLCGMSVLLQGLLFSSAAGSLLNLILGASLLVIFLLIYFSPYWAAKVAVPAKVYNFEQQAPPANVWNEEVDVRIITAQCSDSMNTYTYLYDPYSDTTEIKADRIEPQLSQPVSVVWNNMSVDELIQTAITDSHGNIVGVEQREVRKK